MAISKERLKELIEQGATIYYVDKADNMRGKIDLSEYEVKIVDDYFLIKTRIKPDFSNYFGYEPDWHYDFHIYLSYTFETEEDAEFALRYKRIPRTEYLDLPTWEEIFKQDRCLDCYTKEFAITKNDIVIGICLFGVDFTNKVVEISVGADKIFVGELTKENYLEVCEVARKLWLGEQV